MGKTVRFRDKPNYWRSRSGTSRQARSRRQAFSDLMTCAGCGAELVMVAHAGFTSWSCGCGKPTGAGAQPQALGKPADASAGAER